MSNSKQKIARQGGRFFVLVRDGKIETYSFSPSVPKTLRFGRVPRLDPLEADAQTGFDSPTEQNRLLLSSKNILALLVILRDGRIARD